MHQNKNIFLHNTNFYYTRKKEKQEKISNQNGYSAKIKSLVHTTNQHKIARRTFSVRI